MNGSHALPDLTTMDAWQYLSVMNSVGWLIIYLKSRRLLKSFIGSILLIMPVSLIIGILALIFPQTYPNNGLSGLFGFYYGIWLLWLFFFLMPQTISSIVIHGIYVILDNAVWPENKPPAWLHKLEFMIVILVTLWWVWFYATVFDMQSF